MKTSRRHSPAPRAAELFDQLLVVMAQQGDKNAARRLFERWNPRLLRAAKRYCGNEDAARDLVQECWLAIFKRLSSLRDPARFRSYVFAILHRRGADHLRRVIRERNVLDEDSATGSPNNAQEQPDRAALTQAFAQLPPDQRYAAHLHFVEGLTLREIAHVQSVPEGTAKSRLFHARRKLKAALA